VALGFKVLTGRGARNDTTAPGGKLVFGIFAALAEFERQLIIERTTAGMAAARARGRNGGRPYKMTPSKAAPGRGVPEPTRDEDWRSVRRTRHYSRDASVESTKHPNIAPC
jgi:DNA invertase Pin-like site-specific DNA recombinase